MNLNTQMWKKFPIPKLFNVSAGIYYYSDEYSEGNTPYCSASAENNGVAKKIDLPPDFTGNKIVTGKVGCNAFYQPEPFCATSDVNVLSPKFDMTENIALFIVAVINRDQNYRWNYGRQCRVGDTNNIFIKLPIKLNATGEAFFDESKQYSDEGYVPDWVFMEKYISALNNKRIKTKNHQSNSNTNSNTIHLSSNWGEVRFGDLIEKSYKAKANVKTDLDVSEVLKPGYIRFISRTENNNACDGYVEKEKVEGIEAGNAIVVGDTTATSSYQEQEFVCGDHMVVFRAPWINKYTALFIVTLLNLEKYRYCYGRAFLKDTILDTKLVLPLKQGVPDWEYITDYIKSQPYGDRI